MLRFILLLVITVTGMSYSGELTVYAASNFSYVFDRVKSLYEREHPDDKIRIIYGSSGKGYHQIIRGAPFDIFFSANMKYLKELYRNGYVRSEPEVFLLGKIVLWTGKSSGIRLEGLNTVLNPDVEKIAIANPELAPYGKAAFECLKKTGLYDKVKDKLVIGENISKTAQFVETGAADIGFIALSLAKSKRMKDKGEYIIIDQECYSPIRQGYIILNNENSKTVSRFLNFLKKENVKAVFRNFGYTFPEGDMYEQH
ncbi:MAG TPA: molybdate ABC transporter substrate-binding protein [Persephonella sp.]|uniref:Molybdate ABC transporter, periplasmic molybdate-binding protein n=1 Tax=Persephonella marina (strain DSM 14350 / EX-H1) TaxID=123214 RepID=C0QSN3_PERMH|nr:MULTISPECIES: molybdate ABC transporter substrate-binding protein [Persephonella]ACO03318.1 molybdate ABC transporter, periplasmic molybdate-binding protein [Persephonella marina EX-H1]HCB69426.1 molybdate ABC transporter substrate-binding protein [Persephonella sp.]